MPADIELGSSAEEQSFRSEVSYLARLDGGPIAVSAFVPAVLFSPYLPLWAMINYLEEGEQP